MPDRGNHLRLFLLILLMLSSGPAYAEWVAVSHNKEGMTVYVDPDTIRTKGSMVKVWELYDQEIVQTGQKPGLTGLGGSFLSMKALSEYDCAEERSRSLAYQHFTGNMGRGKLVYSNSVEGKWEPIAPDSIGRFVWKFACKKK